LTPPLDQRTIGTRSSFGFLFDRYLIARVTRRGLFSGHAAGITPRRDDEPDRRPGRPTRSGKTPAGGASFVRLAAQ
jgi:hypothetical protein